MVRAAPSDYRRNLEAEWVKEGRGKPQWGARRVVLNDLSPAATFIAANFNLPFEVQAFAQAGKRLLNEVEQELGWMYETLHTDGKIKGRIEYTVWSEVFTCPYCTGEVVFLNEALDAKTKRVKDTFPCPYCSGELKKDNLERVFESTVDPVGAGIWKRVKFRPCLISYVANGRKYEKQPDETDLALLDRIAKMPLPPEIPTNRFPIEQMYHGLNRKVSHISTSSFFLVLFRLYPFFGEKHVPTASHEFVIFFCYLWNRDFGQHQYVTLTGQLDFHRFPNI